MTTFKEYKEINEDMQDKIVTLLYLAESGTQLNESTFVGELTEAQEALIIEGVNDWLEKVGMKLHKGKGIVDYIKQFSVGAGKMILAAVKKDKKAVKEIANNFDKAELIDFLLKLDMATLHLLSAPIHFINAITGWDLEANLKHMAKGTKGIIDTVKQAFETIKKHITKLVGDDSDGIKAVNNLQKALIPA